MKFLLCSTDNQTFDEYIIGNFPVVGVAERFVMSLDNLFNEDTESLEYYVEALAGLDITLLSIV